MIPDYLTFIRFQDKRNLIYIYAIGLILIGFYWKNAGFTFPSEDIGVVSGILALVLYNFIFDLKAYWAYKCVTKNIDTTHSSATSVSTSGASILEAAVRCAINKKSGVSSCLMKSIVFMVIHYC